MINSSNNSASSATAAAAASSSSSTPPSMTSREYKPASNISLIDCSISIDTTNFVVDIPQQDSGSNQSGSDSGLGGYTNSFSSDNSSFANATTATPLATPILGQAAVESAAKGKNNNNCVSNSNTSNKNNNESSNSNNDSHNFSNGLASSCTKILPLNQRHHHHHNDASGEFVDLAHVFKPRSLDKQTTAFKSKNALIGEPEAQQKPPSPPPLEDHLATSRQSANVPVLKSLLKKPSSHLTSDNAPNKQKHNRNVSFNQTVIVFCEEFGALSPDSNQFEPPLGYQDALGSTFEPPDDYCDHKVDERKAVFIDAEPSSTAAATTRLDTTDSFNHRGAFCSDAASNLTDDQLIGLLENDTLLETFKLNYDDLSEDDYPIGHLNSNHSYLCNDAISDYDSDSESSFCAERKEASNQMVTLKSPVNDNAQNNPLSSNSYQKNRHRSTSSSEPDMIVKSPNGRLFNNESQSSTKFIAQRSRPARMKVSTVVDSGHPKRQFNRQDDHHEPKFKPEQNSSQKGYEHQPQQLLTLLKSTQTEVNARSAPMLVKQTNLEPVGLSKPLMVTNQELTHNSNKNSHNSSTPDSNEQIKNNQILETASGLGNPDHTTRNESQLPAVGVDPNAQGCHICKVIESNKSKVTPDVKNAQMREDSSKIQTSNNQKDVDLIDSNQVQSNNRIVTSQPTVFNQSCVSCREASLQQQNIMQNGFQPVGITRQPIRPAAYQLVYVVDSKGNRVRALSMVRAGVARNPNSSNAGSIPTYTDRRVFIAQNGVRFPNPVSVSGQIVNLQQNYHQHPHPQWNQNPMSAQYKVLSPIPVQNPQTQQNQFDQNSNSNLRPPTYVSAIQRVVPMVRPRPHTVYYVRQPLDTQNICQSFDSTGSISRSPFPDPHEIRRLDGLRGPTATINLSNQINLSSQAEIPDLSSVGDNFKRQPEDKSKQVSNSMREEVDDPTFGFSKRPSVKVVATNSNLTNFNTLNNRSRVDLRNQQVFMNAHPDSLVAVHRVPSQSGGNIRPVSLVVMRSQTLDRGHLSQQSQQQQSMKENMPSTSSMSNIHGSYTNLPSNKVSINSTTQQPRISGVQLRNPTQNNLRTSKEVRSSDLDDTRAENNKNVISNNRVVPVTVNVSDVLSDRNHRKAQGQSDVVYSMNI